MRVKVRLFARLRDVVGASDLERDLAPQSTIGDVWQELVATYPPLAAHSSSVSCARNEEYARMGTPLQEGDEIAFLPPVSGGDVASMQDGSCGPAALPGSTRIHSRKPRAAAHV